MNPTWFLYSIVAAVLITSLTDWFFSGVLFHDKYLLFPQTCVVRQVKLNK